MPSHPTTSTESTPSALGAAPSVCERTGLRLTLLLAALLLVSILRLGIGTTFLGFPAADQKAAWTQRSTRLVEALIVGAALATSGVSLQALLRNPLAEPFLLGLSTGAAVGIIVHNALALRAYPTHLSALIGAAVTMTVVYLASRRRGVIDPLGLLLVGVVISTVNGALIMLVLYLSAGRSPIREDLAAWMMGYLNEHVGMGVIVSVGVLTVMGLAVLVYFGRAMDVASFSATEAASMGVNLPALRTLLFVTASVLAAGAVVLAGPIAFVGLICPHLGRLLVGPRHTPLLPAAAMLGAMLLVLADIASNGMHLALKIGWVPVGVFTAAIGGPAFIWMLRPRLGRGE